MSSPDIIIIGSGMGGATLAYALAPTGASILILDKAVVFDPSSGKRI